MYCYYYLLYSVVHVCPHCFQAIRAPPAEVKCVVFDSVLCWFGFILFGFSY